MTVAVKNEKMTKWLEALTSGDYKQGDSALCAEVDGEKYFCCLGVYEEVVLGTEWHLVNEDDSLYRDQWGNTGVLDSMTAAEIGLDREVTGEEFKKIEDLKLPHALLYASDRMRVLTGLNDDGYSFDFIAGFITTMGWDIDS